MAPPTHWWVPVDYGVNDDPAARVISRAALGVYVQLLVEAHRRGLDHVPCVNHHDPLGTVGVIAWREGDEPGGEAVEPEVRDLVDAGWIHLDLVGRAIRFLKSLPWSQSGRGAAGPSPAAPPPASDTTKPTRSDGPPTPPRGASARNAAEVLRNARFYFKRRSRKPWKEVPAGVTFDAWLASPEGSVWATKQGVAAETCNAPETVAADSATPPATPVTTGGNAPATLLQNPATPLPSHALPSEKTSETEEKREEKTPLPPETGNASQRLATPLQNPATPRCNAPAATAATPTLQRSSATLGNAPITVDEFTAEVRAKVGRHWHLSLSPADRQTLEDAIALTSERWGEEHHEPVTRAHWLAFAAWLEKGGEGGKGGLSWWKNGKPRLAWFTKGTNLPEKFDEAMEWWPERRRAAVEAETTARRPKTSTEATPQYLAPEALSAKAAEASAALRATLAASPVPRRGFALRPTPTAPPAARPGVPT